MRKIQAFEDDEHRVGEEDLRKHMQDTEGEAEFETPTQHQPQTAPSM